jgi:hypothetical protein
MVCCNVNKQVSAAESLQLSSVVDAEGQADDVLGYCRVWYCYAILRGTRTPRGAAIIYRLCIVTRSAHSRQSNTHDIMQKGAGEELL